MNSSNVGGAGAVKNLIRIILIVLVLVAVYYLYKYLFTSSGLKIEDMNSSFKPADGDGPAFISAFPNLIYSGGELSVNMWVYFKDVDNVVSTSGHHIFSLGKASGTGANRTLAGDQTMVVYLEPSNNTMKVGVSTEGTGTTTKLPSSSSGATTFTAPTSNIHATIKDIEFQKWIMLTFTLNNKVLDIYMDGKLARSVVLPGMYYVGTPAQDAIYLTAAAYNGFGGFVGNAKMANYALNPEEVWRLYMSGPAEPFSLGNWFKGLFDPEYLKSITKPGV
jgi:hypothetical protein